MPTRCGCCKILCKKASIKRLVGLFLKSILCCFWHCGILLIGELSSKTAVFVATHIVELLQNIIRVNGTARKVTMSNTAL